MTKLLFILKRREDYNSEKHKEKTLSTGLFNSANFMNEMMMHAGVVSEIEVAIDNNCIDRLVTQHKPTHAIVEALWVVPSKFSVLCPLHPNVKWIIRLHSEMPFMAGEGMAMDWLGEYSSFKNLYIACNAPRMLEEVRQYLTIRNRWSREEAERRVIYLPNYYPQEYKTKKFHYDPHFINIACFGAVRLLKNHLIQAHAALQFAESEGKLLRFHINDNRLEMQGDPVLRNLKGMFMQLHETGHQMIGHEWRPRDQFLELCATMDIGIQCNFSETFNIVTADLVSQGIPFVGCNEIPWSSSLFNARPTHVEEIVKALRRTYSHPGMNVSLNQSNLAKYTNKTRKIWKAYFEQEASHEIQG